jgi:hypothetical protein
MSTIDGWTLVFFLYTCGLVALTGFVFRRLRVEDPKIWIELGSPSFLALDASTNIYKFWRWTFFSTKRETSLSHFTLKLLRALQFGTFFALMAFLVMIFRGFS